MFQECFPNTCRTESVAMRPVERRKNYEFLATQQHYLVAANNPSVTQRGSGN